MYELIQKYNTSETHIEIDTISQVENGMSADLPEYTYTVHLINNKTNDPLVGAISIDQFSMEDIKFVDYMLSGQLKKLLEEQQNDN